MMAVSFEQKAKEVAPQIRELMKSVDESANPKATESIAAKQIEAIAVETNLAYVLSIYPWESSVHPDNRYQSMLECFDVQGLASLFATKGCIPKKQAGAQAWKSQRSVRP